MQGAAFFTIVFHQGRARETEGTGILCGTLAMVMLITELEHKQYK
jgi:hypothetical protein